MKHSTGVNVPISNLIVITDRHLIANRGLSVMGDIFPLSAVNQQKIPLRFLYVNCARGMIMKGYSQANNKTSSPDQRAKDRGTQREYSSKPLKHSIVKRILVFKR